MTNKLSISLLFVYGIISLMIPGILKVIHPELSTTIWFISPVMILISIFVHIQVRKHHVEFDLLKSVEKIAESQIYLTEKIAYLEKILENNNSSSETTENHLESKIEQEIKEGLPIEGSTLHESNKQPSHSKIIDYPQKNEDSKTKESSKTLNSEDVSHILLKAIKSDKIEMLLQPIVSLPQRKLKYYECFSRIRDEGGTILLPDHYLSIAETQSVIRIIDNTLLLRCAQLIKQAKRKYYSAHFFCNLSIQTIKDEEFFSSFVDFIRANQSMGPDIIFEFDARNLDKIDHEVQEKLKRLSRFGCRFSLDHVCSYQLDLQKLKGLNFRFIKIDANVLLNTLKETDGPEKIKKFKSLIDKYRIEAIITKIEEENILLEILDFHFDYGQGYLFCPPRLHGQA